MPVYGSQDMQGITPNAAEELTQILWSSLPRPAPFWHVKRSKRAQLCPDFLHDLIERAGQSDGPLKLENESCIGRQSQASPRQNTAHREQLCPHFLHDLIERSGQFDVPLQLKTESSIGGQPLRTAHVRASVIKNRERISSRVTDCEGNHVLDRDLRGLCEKGRLSEALWALDLSDQEGGQLEDLFYWLLHGCINKKDLSTGREVHSRIIRRGFQSNAFVVCQLIQMFAVCGSLSEASQVFSSLLAPDCFAWTAIISAHANLGQGKQAIKLYTRMQQSNVRPGAHVFVAILKACSSIVSLHHGKMIHRDAIIEEYELDAYVGTMLIGMYAKCGSLEDACKVFDGLPKQDAVTYSAMMAVYVEYGDDNKALGIFDLMQEEGMQPDNVMQLVCAVKACSNLAAKHHGKLVHCLVIERGADLNVYAGSALIDMYVKCGDLEEACNVFAKLPKRSEVTWSAMIAAFAHLNNYDLALKYFEDMLREHIKPNGVTFISILSACSHAGMLHEGFCHFKSMWDDHGITPTVDHYNCIVDLLGRAGHLVEAEDLLHAMPFKPNIVGCMALLSHCKTHGNVAVGRQSFHHAVKMDIRDASGYMLLSEIYTDASMWKDANKVRAWRKHARAFKKPGEASIHVGKEVHTFTGGERSHPSSIDIDAKLAQVGVQLKAKGYFPCLDLIQIEQR